MGASGLAAHFCMTRAFMVFYGEPLEFTVLLGATVMFAGTYYSIQRESRRP
jgi:hypothetical protein